MINQTYTPIKLDFTSFNPGSPTASQATKIPSPLDPSSTTTVSTGFVLGAYGTISAAGGFPAKVTVSIYDGDPEGAAFNLIYEVVLEFSANGKTVSDLMTGEVVTFRRGAFVRCETDQTGTTIAVSPVIGTGDVLPYTG